MGTGQHHSSKRRRSPFNSSRVVHTQPPWTGCRTWPCCTSAGCLSCSYPGSATRSSNTFAAVADRALSEVGRYLPPVDQRRHLAVLAKTRFLSIYRPFAWTVERPGDGAADAGSRTQQTPALRPHHAPSCGVPTGRTHERRGVPSCLWSGPSTGPLSKRLEARGQISQPLPATGPERLHPATVQSAGRRSTETCSRSPG